MIKFQAYLKMHDVVVTIPKKRIVCLLLQRIEPVAQESLAT